MNADYWENRYQTRDMPWEKGEPSPGLVDFLAARPEIPRGTVCVPGCGTGHDARVFARAGFPTFGFDFAPSAVEAARTKSTGLSITFAQSDFLHDEPAGQFDWIFEHTLFCAIEPKERDDYVRAVSRWLKPGGQFLAVNYIECDPAGPPFPTTREEQVQRFSPQFDLLEDWVPRSYPNRTGRERMFWWRLRSARP